MPEPLTVVPKARLGLDDRQRRRVLRRFLQGVDRARLRDFGEFVRAFPEQKGHRDDRHGDESDQRQQPTIAEVVVDVHDERRHLHLRHLQGGTFEASHGAPPRVVAAGVEDAPRGLSGLAPPVAPCSGGVR